jgi:hypothetical protein
MGAVFCRRSTKVYMNLKVSHREDDGNRYLDDPDRKIVKFLTIYIGCM